MYLTLREFLKIPTYDDERYVTTGRIEIDQELCKGCGMCVMICPGKAIRLEEKKAKFEEDFPQCMSCSDCVAICENNAIRVTVPYNFRYFYKTLHRGDLVKPRKF